MDDNIKDDGEEKGDRRKERKKGRNLGRGGSIRMILERMMTRRRRTRGKR